MRNVQLKGLFCLLLASCFLSSCSTIDVYEKTVALPGHKWAGSFKPEFSFTISDTAALYDLFFVIRHTEKYNYNNIFINLHYKEPGADNAVIIQKELVLATDDKGWLGTGMDDVYEQRKNLTPEGIRFFKPGTYTFAIEQIMREQPLEHVMNAGIRVEKKQAGHDN